MYQASFNYLNACMQISQPAGGIVTTVAIFCLHSESCDKAALQYSVWAPHGCGNSPDCDNVLQVTNLESGQALITKKI